MNTAIDLDVPAIDPTLAVVARDIRRQIRAGRETGSSRGMAPGLLQCNLVILPEKMAFDFMRYCQRNQRACPLIDVGDPGDPIPHRLAPEADIRTDVARYAVYRQGRRVEDRIDILDLWRDDLVAFYIGSGITFDGPLNAAGVQTERHRWVLGTRVPTIPAGRFRGPLVVTMRWLTAAETITAVQVTSRFPRNHGAPIHIGAPEILGVDVEKPYFGAKVPAMPDNLLPVFWACGVTPQAAAIEAKIDFMITHAPAHSFITDLPAAGFQVGNEACICDWPSVMP